MPVFIDQLHRKLQLNAVPKRIVSLVPSQTELLCDLGLEKDIVGITKFCVHPNHLRSAKKIVGGTKQVHLDKIAALNPDIILCNKEENSKAMIADLEAIAQVHISDIFTIGDSQELIAMYGELFNKEMVAKELQESIAQQQEAFQDYLENKINLSVAYFIWKSPYMVAANNTFINYILQQNKLDNVFSAEERYPEIIVEHTDKNPDLVFLSSEPYPFTKEHINEFESFFPNSKIILVDGEMFSWYGSHLTKAFDYFKALNETCLR
ncbi:ABC transporter substrate-binding protein [Formosa haliotis]|uniref:ABC transporter substrate-binding protein n=1 Tax=Formosa haliotis TaxID=1555194 RepID=UPI000824EEAD|nr:helical backbone metal receptor [Formosa haliotis]